MTADDRGGGEVLGQAVYGWFSAGWDGRRGVGFGRLSPALQQEHQLFDRWRPEAFGAPEDLPDDAELVGRLIRDGLAIVYRKTPRGQIDNRGRPHTLVHAIIGSATLLDVTSCMRIMPSAWLTRLDTPTLDRLPDLDSEAVLAPSSNQHRCAQDDERQRTMLRSLTMCTDAIEVALSAEALNDLDYLLPRSLSRWLSVTPSFDGTRATSLVTGIDKLIVAESIGQDVHTPARCAIGRGRRAVADDFEKRGVEFSCVSFARALTDHLVSAAEPPRPQISEASTRTDAIGAQTAAVGMSARDRSVAGLLRAIDLALGSPTADGGASGISRAVVVWVQEGGDPKALLSQEGEEGLARLAMEAPTASVIRDWHRVFARVPARRVVEAWNRTRKVPLLGTILLGLADGAALPGLTLAPIPSTNHARRMLREVLAFHHGAEAIAHAIGRGLAGTDEAKAVICNALAEHPDTLYNHVIPSAGLDDRANFEFIRASPALWAAHHKFADWEQAVVGSLMRPSVIRRVLDILKG